MCRFKSAATGTVATQSCYGGSAVEVLVPGALCPPLSEVHVDVGRYEIVHLVPLLKRRHGGEESK